VTEAHNARPIRKKPAQHKIQCWRKRRQSDLINGEVFAITVILIREQRESESALGEEKEGLFWPYSK